MTTAKSSIAAVLISCLGACASGDDPPFAAADSDGRADAPSHAQEAPAAPTREALEATIDTLLAALPTGTAEAKLAPSARVTENGKDVKLTASRLASARAFTYRAFFAEPAAGQAGLFGVADVGALPLAFSLRVRADAAGAIGEVEILTVQSGEFWYAAPEALRTPHAMYQTSVPAPTSREQLVAVATAYFDGIEKASGEGVQFADGCVRLENGMQTTLNPGAPQLSVDCKAALGTMGYIDKIRDRRFPLVDVERGLVFAEALFDVPGERYTVHLPQQPIVLDVPANTWHVAEVFKIVGGRIERVEAVLRYDRLGTASAWPASDAASAPAGAPPAPAGAASGDVTSAP